MTKSVIRQEVAVLLSTTQVCPPFCGFVRSVAYTVYPR